MLRDENAASYRSLNEKWDASERNLNNKYDAIVRDFHDKLGTYFRWTIGIVLASWLSTMGAILFKGSL